MLACDGGASRDLLLVLCFGFAARVSTCQHQRSKGESSTTLTERVRDCCVFESNWQHVSINTERRCSARARTHEICSMNGKEEKSWGARGQIYQHRKTLVMMLTPLPTRQSFLVVLIGQIAASSGLISTNNKTTTTNQPYALCHREPGQPCRETEGHGASCSNGGPFGVRRDNAWRMFS